MVNQEDSGGSSAPIEYESFGSKVNVEVTDLVSYYQEMSMLSGEIGTAAGSAMGEMSMMISTGLSQPGDDAGAFPEGLMAARSMSNRLSDFQHFMTDLNEGVRNVGSAAAVVAEIYENADSENGATVADIGFVFSDPRATPPSGFRDVKTFNELAEETGQNTMALSGDTSTARALSYPYGTIYTFPDGSTRHVTWSTQAAAGHNSSPVSVTTTTIRDANGNVISTVTERSYSNHMGYTYNTTTNVTGDDRNNRTSTTTTATAPSGDVTVTNTTQSTTDGKAGEQNTSTTTVERDQHREGTDQGPVETAQQNLDTDGSEYFVGEYGRGY
ncbi:hypothetical protein [Phytohabitans kaempferiae]|uniref:Uncharacterized protein n=1 Tax=Phytohabitans kaempferiae TaxID=1620943 RepID=A0ABV6M9H7_9ACTN